jgi:hypothetical protein
MLFHGMARGTFTLLRVAVRGHRRIAARDVEMREVLAGRHEQGDRHQQAEVGLEAGEAHGNGGRLSGGFRPRN